ncbi:hypothetical protein GCM10009540_07230 [Streptomyces turgidiscabies]
MRGTPSDQHVYDLQQRCDPHPQEHRHALAFFKTVPLGRSGNPPAFVIDTARDKSNGSVRAGVGQLSPSREPRVRSTVFVLPARS